MHTTDPTAPKGRGLEKKGADASGVSMRPKMHRTGLGVQRNLGHGAKGKKAGREREEERNQGTQSP